MPTRIQVIRANDFVRARPEGHLDLEGSGRVLDGIMDAVADLPTCSVVLDTRKAQVNVSAFDLWFLAQRLAEHRNGCVPKMAVLCPQERFDRARFFALCAVAHGFRVRPFTSYEDAMEWLILDDA